MKLVKPASCVSSWETDISFHFCPYHFFTLNGVSNYSVLCIPQLTKCPNCSCIRYLPALQTKSRQCLPWGKRWSSMHLSPYVHAQHSVLILRVATVSTSSPHKSSLPSRSYFNFSEGMWHTWENRQRQTESLYTRFLILGLQLSSVCKNPCKLRKKKIPLALPVRDWNTKNSHLQPPVENKLIFNTHLARARSISTVKWPHLIRCKLLTPNNMIKLSNIAFPYLRNWFSSSSRWADKLTQQ